MFALRLVGFSGFFLLCTLCFFICLYLSLCVSCYRLPRKISWIFYYHYVTLLIIYGHRNRVKEPLMCCALCQGNAVHHVLVFCRSHRTTLRIYLVLMNSRGTRPEKYREQFTISGVDVPWRGAVLRWLAKKKKARTSMVKALQQQPQPPTHRRKNIFAFNVLSSPFSSCVVDDVTRRLFNSERRSQSRENAVESVAETKISLSGIFEYFRYPLWFLCLYIYSCFNDSVVVEQQIFYKEWVKGILKSGWVEYAEKESQMEWLGK